MANTQSATFVAASSQYFSASDSASLSITGDITIELWVKPASAPSSGNSYGLVGKNTSAGNQLSYALSYNNIGGTLKLRLFIDQLGTGSTFDNLDKTQTLTLSVWTHVAVAWTASTKTAEFFINGVSIGTVVGTLASSIFNSTSILAIGQYGAALAGSYYDGKIDEVRVWSLVRSAANILANLYTPIDTATSLQGSWHLDNALTDASGNTNTLTNNGTVTFTTDCSPFGITLSESSVSSDSTSLSISIGASFSDSSVSSDSATGKIGFANTSKSSSTWANTSKS